MKLSFKWVLTLLGSLWLLQGCASTSDIVTRYGASTAPGERLLLATRSPEPALRRQWEDACAPLLRKQGFDVVTSMDVLPAWFATGTDELEKWASANGVPGILVAELSALLPEPAHYNPAQGLGDNRSHHDVQVVVPAKVFREARDAPEANQNIDIELFDAAGRIQWRAELVTHEANNIPAIARSQCAALANVLTRKMP
ncbi:hypothetical protein [Alcanivorax quisquiliarum]|uniref:DUF4136 domain-containing protein n=1 Tax=Alcanivorax quisquiliarum TaxID=2933565 RepID=A0ABT0E478_9GAMM|nr:hypothetical protein [Alcanivorax quisquiliarum]MCK0536610.1 hypothetical protein [Alcanivorax quisquiliarum]